jgi:hypothetical protein
LQIIFQYHTKNKLILFIGLPKNLSYKINKLTSHISLSKYSNLQGVISNSNKSAGALYGLESSLEQKIAKKPCLVFLMDHVKMDSIIKESYLAKIPLICVNTDFDSKTFLYSNTYKLVIQKSLLQPLSNFLEEGLSFLFKSPNRQN